MTPQEAIEFINNEVQIDVRFCTDEMIEKTKEAFELAISALEKQMPKKPLEENRYYGQGECPACGAVFVDKDTQYCGNCGQALDWSDTE